MITQQICGPGPPPQAAAAAAAVPPLPDLSHLSESERQIIQSVMLRQQRVEEEQAQVLKKKQDEVYLLESAIRKRNEEHKILGVELEATCQICLKTKFADGVGHVCNYCNMRCCARCGGKVALRSTRTIWVCLLCRKRQELLIKTGNWIHSSMAGKLKQLETEAESPMLERVFSTMVESTLAESFQSARRNSLGRLPSGAQIRDTLKRQFSHDSSQPQQPQQYGETSRPVSAQSSGVTQVPLSKPSMSGDSIVITGATKQRILIHQPKSDSTPSHRIMPDVPRDVAASAATLTNRLQRRQQPTPNQIASSYTSVSIPNIALKSQNVPPTFVEALPVQSTTSTPATSSAAANLRRKLPFQRQKSRELPLLENVFSRSIETVTSEMNPYSNFKKQLPKIPSFQEQSMTKSTGNLYPGDAVKSSSVLKNNLLYPMGSQKPFDLAEQKKMSESGRSLPTVGLGQYDTAQLLRNDSLGSEHSDSYLQTSSRVNPRKMKMANDHRRFRLYKSLSSSEDEVRSTPEFSTEDDFDLEIESMSEHALTLSGQSSEHFLRHKALLKPDDILDAKMKNFLVYPIKWKMSADGTYTVGHMILKKHLNIDSTFGSSTAILGLKVFGGRVIEPGRLGAVIEKVKKGSIADTIGRLRPGDEVLEWNRIPLKGKTYEEVQDIISESKQCPEIELLVARHTNKGNAQLAWQSYHQKMLTEEFMQQNRIGRRHTDVIPPITNQLSYDKNLLLTRGSSLGAEFNAKASAAAAAQQSLLHRNTPKLKVTRSSTISGRIQVKLWYDAHTLELMVTIANAIELSPRKTGLLRNPYVKMHLLPDRSERTKKRTKTVVNSNEPIWNETFTYSPIRHLELSKKALDISVWDYDRYCANEFLGQVVIELGNAKLDNEVEWYLLSTYDEILAQAPYFFKKYLFSDRYSPSTLSRLSDSELSEIDLDEEYNTSKESWLGLPVETSQSSLGSSSSPPGVPALYGEIGGGKKTSAGHPTAAGGATAQALYHQQSFQSCHSHDRVHYNLPQRAQSSLGVYHDRGVMLQSGGGEHLAQLLLRGHGSSPTTLAASHSSGRLHHRPEILSSSSLPSSSYGLHSSYAALPSVAVSTRPEFRKSSSQPTRSLSPPIIRSPSSLVNPLGGSCGYIRQTSITGTPKRHLPPIPATHSRMLSMSIDPMGMMPAYQDVRLPGYGGYSTTMPASENIYSDSEIMMKPVFGNRPLYGHPSTREQQLRQHRYQHQQYRSTDEVIEGRGGVTSDHEQQYHPSRSYPIEPSTSQRHHHHQHHQQQPATTMASVPTSRRPLNYSKQMPSHDIPSESDSFQSPTAYQRPSKYHHHHHQSQPSTSAATGGERGGSGLKHRQSVDYPYEKEEGAEYSDEAQYHNQKHRVSRKHSGGSNAEDKREQQTEQHIKQDAARRHSKASAMAKSAEYDEGTSRGQKPRQSISAGSSGGGGGVPAESTRRESTHHVRRPVVDSELESETESSTGSKKSTTFAVPLATGEGVAGGRSKTSRTLNEFTGRQQQSGPVHPPHPSRSALAVARSLSERSKEDRSQEVAEKTPKEKSYADQIDEVMEQLNANCDLSMEDLYGATTSASTTSLNASSTGEGGKKGKGRRGGTGGGESGLTKKSNSTSQLSVSGTKKRLGFRKKQPTSFSVHRSEEVLPDEMRHLRKQNSSISSDGEGSLSGDSSLALAPIHRNQSGDQGNFSNFVDGLGPGQIAGRQALASLNLGDVQLSLADRKGNLEVEVIRARGLQTKGRGILPAAYVKVYLIKNRKIIAKAKTATARRTLDPLFQQPLHFSDNYKGCCLHVVVYAEYGRMEKKSFMGLVQIVLDDLDLSNIVIGWYKIFNSTVPLTYSTGGSSAGGSSGGRGGGGGGGGGGGHLSGQFRADSANNLASYSGTGSLMSASMESFG